MNAVAKNLKELRMAAGLTQDQLAETLHVTRQAVSSWETGRSEPDLDTLAALAEALGADPAELIYGRKEPDYPKKQRKYVICCIVFGAVVLLGILSLYTVRLWLLAYKGRTFDPIPYFVYLTGFLPLVFAAGGALLMSILSLGNDLRIRKPWSVICLLFGIACLTPALTTAVQFAAWRPAVNLVSTIDLIFPFAFNSIMDIDIFLKLLPFLGGAGIFLGVNGRK